MTFVHTPEQLVSVGAQAHDPLEQTCPEAQTTPQPPQLLVSERVLTQEPPQLVRPVVQVLWQAPTEHT